MSPPARLILSLIAGAGVAQGAESGGWRSDGYHVFPGESLQAALDEVATQSSNKVIKVHAGTYRPARAQQALIWFTRAHDAIRLEAVGEVTLSAANPAVSDGQSPAHPAVVNHVVYFGDGITEATVLDGFKITGANHFVTTHPPEIEPAAHFKKDLFFYSDGGAIKVFGRSSPTLRRLAIEDNYASPCAGGVSVQQQWLSNEPAPSPVRIENCVFRRNRSQVTGAAVDLLPGSAAVISNCLFAANMANLGVNYISPNPAQPEFTNSAPLTVFPSSRAVVQFCTFTGNRNGAEDLGHQSVYQNCIFWKNDLGGAFYGGRRYELDLEGEANVSGCFFGEGILDPRGQISGAKNNLAAADPQFSSQYLARSPEYAGAGLRSPACLHDTEKK